MVSETSELVECQHGPHEYRSADGITMLPCSGMAGDSPCGHCAFLIGQQLVEGVHSEEGRVHWKFDDWDGDGKNTGKMMPPIGPVAVAAVTWTPPWMRDA